MLARPSTRSNSNLAARRPSSCIGWRTVVSGGCMRAAIAVSSHPVTITSSGTLKPEAVAARTTPTAISSLAHITASVPFPRANSSRPALYPCSTSKPSHVTSVVPRLDAGTLQSSPNSSPPLADIRGSGRVPEEDWTPAAVGEHVPGQRFGGCRVGGADTGETTDRRAGQQDDRPIGISHRRDGCIVDGSTHHDESVDSIGEVGHEIAGVGATVGGEDQHGGSSFGGRSPRSRRSPASNTGRRGRGTRSPRRRDSEPRMPWQAGWGAIATRRRQRALVVAFRRRQEHCRPRPGRPWRSRRRLGQRRRTRSVATRRADARRPSPLRSFVDTGPPVAVSTYM